MKRGTSTKVSTRTGGGVVAAGPVAGQAAADEREDVGSEVGDADPGQDEEPGVVDDQRQVLPAQGGGPSDEAVARREGPGGGAEAEHGERPAVAVVDGVAHLGADEGLVAEIVVAGDELVPQPALPGAADDGADLQRADLAEGRGRRGRGAARYPVRRRWGRAASVSTSGAAGR